MRSLSDFAARWLTWPLWTATALGMVGVVAFCSYMLGRTGAEKEHRQQVRVTPVEELPYFRQVVAGNHRDRLTIFQQRCVIADLAAENGRLRSACDEARHRDGRHAATCPQLPPVALPPELPAGDLIPATSLPTTPAEGKP